MKRELSIKFTSFNIARYENDNNTTFLDMISDIQSDGLKIYNMAKLLTVGRNMCSIEDACDVIDKWLAEDDSRTVISLFVQLIGEYDIDTKILKMMGITSQTLIDGMNAKMEESIKEGARIVESFSNNSDNGENNNNNIDIDSNTTTESTTSASEHENNENKLIKLHNDDNE